MGTRQNELRKVAVLLGATAVGKTALAMRLAQELGLEILSCDSRQIYRHMDIGTAKPTLQDRARIRHHLVDCVDPSKEYSAFTFASDATSIINERAAHGQLLLLCGGTGLYFKMLSQGVGPRVETDPDFRRLIEQRAAKDGVETIFSELERVDPRTAKRLHPNDLHRVIRALQVYRDTGVPLSRQVRDTRPIQEFCYDAYIVDLPRSQLYAGIDSRVESMLEKGLWQEFKGLRARGYTAQSPGMRTLGYRELFDVESGASDIATVGERIKQHTRKYAKRQITWFSRQVRGNVVDLTRDNHYARLRDGIGKFLGR